MWDTPGEGFKGKGLGRLDRVVVRICRVRVRGEAQGENEKENEDEDD